MWELRAGLSGEHRFNASTGDAAPRLSGKFFLMERARSTQMTHARHASAGRAQSPAGPAPSRTRGRERGQRAPGPFRPLTPGSLPVSPPLCPPAADETCHTPGPKRRTATSRGRDPHSTAPTEPGRPTQARAHLVRSGEAASSQATSNASPPKHQDGSGPGGRRLAQRAAKHPQN